MERARELIPFGVKTHHATAVAASNLGEKIEREGGGRGRVREKDQMLLTSTTDGGK